MQTPALISQPRTIVLAAVTALLMMSAVLPISAQNSVPASAVQASKMPQYASRLAPPASRPASRPNLRSRSRSGPPQSGEIYDNGPINGTADAWTINSGYVVSDTITVGAADTDVTGMAFGVWLNPGDTLTSAELSITSPPGGGTTYFDQTVSLSLSGCTINLDGFNVCTASATFQGPALNAGVYWVNLQNASVPSGDPAYWDENSGVGCTSPGCPSEASDNNVGTIPSESFTMLGNPGPTTCYQSQGNLQIIYGQGGGQDGVTIDRAGNLYGAGPGGGAHNAPHSFHSFSQFHIPYAASPVSGYPS
jgi:hypothetical protein